MLTNYPDVLTVPELAEFLRISTATTYQLLRSGVLRSIRVGKRIIVPKKFVLDFLAQPDYNSDVMVGESELSERSNS